VGFVTTQGPIYGSALFVSPPARAWDESQARIRRRRQIGSGPRSIIVTKPGKLRTRRTLRASAPKDRTSMKRSTLYVLFTGAFLFSAAAFGIGSQMDSPPSLMSRGDYAAGRQAIESETRQAMGRCRALDGQAREMCKAEARAAERVKKADLTARYLGTVAAAEEAKLARVRAEYDLARVKCGIESGAQRGECLTAARAVKVRAIAGTRPATT
jgi:hypothetical protein